MSNFKATNDFNLTRFGFYERLRYKINALTDTKHTNIREMNFSDFVFYGKVNPSYESIYLSGLDNINYTLRGKPILDFVSDAFADLQQHFKDALGMEMISIDEKFLSNIKCHNSFEDPLSSYDSYIDELFLTYNQIYLKNIKVDTFSVYLDNLVPYMNKLTAEFPMNFSSWIKNKRCSPFSTGLYINVSNNNLGNDILKEKDFINSPNFDFYVSTCKSRGFYVERSNPSVLIVDLDSKQIEKFLIPHGLKNSTDIIEKYYKLAYERDAELLSSKIYEHFNNYREENVLLVDVKVSRNNKIYTQIKERNINNININNNILIKLYTNIKNIEEGNIFGQADIDKFIQNAKNVEKRFDISRAIRYINREFSSTYRSRYGGLNYYLNKQIPEDE